MDDCVPAIETFEPAECYLRWEMELEPSAPLARIEAVFIFCMDADIEIKAVAEGNPMDDPAADQASTAQNHPEDPGKSAPSQAPAYQAESIPSDGHRTDA